MDELYECEIALKNNEELSQSFNTPRGSPCKSSMSSPKKQCKMKMN